MYQQPMMVPAKPIPKGRMSMGAILGIVGLVLAIVGLVSLGWYVIEVDFFVTFENSYGLTEVELTSEDLGSEKASYEDAVGSTDDSEAYAAANTTKWMLIVGIILTLLFIIFAFVAVTGALKGGATWGPVLMGVIAGLFVLITAIYFAVAFPGGLEDDMGMDLDEITTSNGLGATWFLVLIAGILVMIGGLMTKAPSTAAQGVAPPIPQY